MAENNQKRNDGGLRRKVQELERENDGLKNKIKELEQRIKELERIPCTCGDGLQRDVNDRIVAENKIPLKCQTCNGTRIVLLGGGK